MVIMENERKKPHRTACTIKSDDLYVGFAFFEKASLPA